MSAIEKCRKAYVETEIDGEKVLMKLADGRFFSLAGPALAIWDTIDGTRDREAIVALLGEEYDAPREQIAPDVSEFLDALAAAGLIAG